MPKSSPPHREEKNKASETTKHEATRTVVIFWSYSPTLEKILTGQLGKRPSQTESHIIHESHIKSRRNPVVVLQAPPFEDPAAFDSTTFCRVALELQTYIETRLNYQSHNFISIFYLHLDPANVPTLAAQRNFRALWHLGKHLNIASLSVCVILSASPKEPPQDLPHYLSLWNSIDSRIWGGHFAYSRPQTMNQFLEWVLNTHQGKPYTRPPRPVTNDELTHTFCETDTKFFEALEHERIKVLEDVVRAQSERQNADKEAQLVKQELENLTIQHNSLLQQLNLRDNTEISDIVQQFRGLNDEIDEFSLNIARTIADDAYKRYPDCEKCSDPAGLRAYIGAPDKSLLIFQSSNGTSVKTQQFLELYSGSVMCRYLHIYVFRPFYPVAPQDSEAHTQCNAFTQVYNELRLSDPQMLSSKWRVDTYSTIRRVSSARRQNLAHDLASHIASKIAIVCGHLFGDQVKPAMDNSSLSQLVERALKLNDRIKEDVVHAGDIHTNYFGYDSPYEDSKMKVLDYEPGDPLPTHIVSTCGLGVGFTKALGGRKQPESAILLKAVVASEQMYE